jgi:biopolymer transport protein ExbD
MSFQFAPARPRRRPSLTPMIDVVFLLLVFFMLAARFGQEGALDLRIAGGGAEAWQGPPRLVQVEANGLQLNGQAVGEEALISTLIRLIDTGGDLVVIQPAEGVALQRLLDVVALLEGAGFSALTLVDP